MQTTSLHLVAELRGHQERVWQVSWSPTTLSLVSVAGDRSIRVWTPSTSNPATNCSSWVCAATIGDAHSRTIRSVAFNPNGRVFASGSFDATVGIWERTAGPDVEPSIECIASLEGHENEVKSVAWSVSGSLLATCSRDKSVWIWEVIGDEEYECSCVLQEHSQDVKSVQWHPHDEILASASYDDTVKIWREEDSDWYCSDTLVGHTSTVWAIDFDASGNKLASVSDDKSLRIWKLDTAGRYKSYAEALNHHERAIYSVAWSKHTGLIATASGDNCIKICRLVEHDGEHGSIETVCSLPESHGLNDINHVVWCPLESHSELLASAGDDGVVRIWRVHRD